MNQELDFLSEQTFVVDPRSQGFGLSELKFLDSYANKFMLLAGEGGTFASPQAPSSELLGYYESLGFSLPEIVPVPTNDGSSITDALSLGNSASRLNTKGRSKYIVPYMVNPEVASFADEYGFDIMASPETTAALADKAILQTKLAEARDDILEQTGFDITVPSSYFTAGDRGYASSSYEDLSEGGREDVVVIKPRSASGMGIFVVRAAQGRASFDEVLDSKFSEEESVLLEKFIPHTHSPSMQGIRTANSEYRHLYFGRQIIAIDDDGLVEYDASQIPFGPETLIINPRDLARIQAVHEALGEVIVKNHGITGIAGFDSVARIDSVGEVHDFRIVELNLHLPSTMAVYAAITKLFPDGFRGIAHNMNISLADDMSPSDFLNANHDDVVHDKETLGIFPLNTSFDNQIDVVLLAKDREDLNERLAGIS